jgi:hypothetical protein
LLRVQPRFEKVQADNAASKKRRKPSGSKTTAKAKQIADGRTTVEKTRATKAKGKVKTKTAVKIVEGSGAPSYSIALSRGGVSSLAKPSLHIIKTRRPLRCCAFRKAADRRA